MAITTTWVILEILQHIATATRSIRNWVDDNFVRANNYYLTILWTINSWWMGKEQQIIQYMNNYFLRQSDVTQLIVNNITSWWASERPSLMEFVNVKILQLRLWLNYEIVLLSIRITDAEQRVITNVNLTITNLLPWFAARILDTTTWMIKTLANVPALNNLFATILAQIIDIRFLNFSEWRNDIELERADWVRAQIRDSIVSLSEYFQNQKEEFLRDQEYMAEWVVEEIEVSKKEVLDEVPGIVEDMFEWAKPILEPLKESVAEVSALVKAFTGEYERPPERQKTIDELNEARELLRKLWE